MVGIMDGFRSVLCLWGWARFCGIASAGNGGGAAFAVSGRRGGGGGFGTMRAAESGCGPCGLIDSVVSSLTRIMLSILAASAVAMAAFAG